MPKVTPEEGADKLISNAKSAAPRIAAQVDKVTEAPTAAAAKKLDKMRMKFNEAVDSGKVKRGLDRVTLGDWQAAMKTKGIPRIASGLDSARDKITEFNREFYPFLEGVERDVHAMPDTTLEDGINRMVTNVRKIAEFKRSK